MQAYSKPLSLWSLVEQIVPPHEHGEIKEMLGSSLVEQSLELHYEISMLLEIWREMRDEQKEKTLSPRGLPEPPNQRNRLVQEICFFVENVKEKAKQKGIDPQHILKRHNSDIIDYATEISRPGSAVSRTSRSSDGKETPMMMISAERMNLAYEITDEVEAVNKQLNYMDFDRVCRNLRSTLEKELEQLLEDIQFLQGCLDAEADIRDCVTPRPSTREPTLMELREERSLLEKELLATGNLTATPFVNKPNFNKELVLPQTPPSSSDSSPPVMPALVLKCSDMKHLHENIPPSDRQSSPVLKAGPLKASHQIVHAVASTAPATPNVKLLPSKSVVAVGQVQATPVKPRPPFGSHSEGDIRTVTVQKRPNHMPHNDHLSSFTVTKPRDMVFPGGARRRNISPGRLRVVDLASIVDIHSGKGESVGLHVDSSPTFSSSSSSSASSISFTTSPPTDLSDRDTVIRPGSAHADRFRKMVQGCRDGE
ncbi:unnamed protein product [Lymnaea stagnalis]|uniref:Coiled-coil domain-containing protein 24 n=1 Tax=Lymnaea stagnalis TaxID=6523 RepID=A0AAV2HI34_LYMST